MPWKKLEDVPPQVRTRKGAKLTLAQANRWAAIFDSLVDEGMAKGKAAAIAWSRWEELFVRQGDHWVRRTRACRAIVEHNRLRGQNEEGIPVPDRTKDPTKTQVARERFASRLSAAVGRMFTRLTRWIASQESIAATTTTTTTTTTSLKGLITTTQVELRIREEIAAYLLEAGAITEEEVNRFVDKGEEFANRQMGRANRADPNAPTIEIAFDIPTPPEVRRALSENTMDFLRDTVDDELVDKIIDQVKESVEAGRGPAGIAADIADLTHFPRNRAIKIARTESIRALATGTKARYARSGIDRVMWIASLDERTDDSCEALHGVIFDLNNTPEDPPLHPQCRCAWAPVIRGSSNQHLVEFG